MAKFVREIDGVRYVGVVVSRGFGAGWSTWNGCDPCDGDFIQYLIDNGKVDNEDDETWYVDIEQEIVEEFFNGNNKPYCDGADGFVIEWLEEGTRFRIDGYDGAESIEIFDPDYYMTA